MQVPAIFASFRKLHCIKFQKHPAYLIAFFLLENVSHNQGFLPATITKDPHIFLEGLINYKSNMPFTKLELSALQWQRSTDQQTFLSPVPNLQKALKRHQVCWETKNQRLAFDCSWLQKAGQMWYFVNTLGTYFHLENSPLLDYGNPKKKKDNLHKIRKQKEGSELVSFFWMDWNKYSFTKLPPD